MLTSNDKDTSNSNADTGEMLPRGQDLEQNGSKDGTTSLFVGKRNLLSSEDGVEQNAAEDAHRQKQNSNGGNQSQTGPQRIGALYLECFNDGEPGITVIGGGKMATALVNGFVTAGCFAKSRVFICTRSSASAQQWRNQGFVSAFPQDSFYSSVKRPRGLVLISVKPQVFPVFVEEMRRNEWFYFGSPELLCVSIMAGISLKHFDEQLRSVGFEGHAARMMPNVNCAISSGTLVISARPEMPREFMDLLQTLGSSVGSCIRVDEAQFNAASAISGCGPAFVAIAMEAVADGGVVSGLNRELAVQLTAEMFKGTAQLFLSQLASSSSASPAQLKDQVCSPAGTTIAGVRELERNGIRSAFIEAVQASTKRAFELSK